MVQDYKNTKNPILLQPKIHVVCDPEIMVEETQPPKVGQNFSILTPVWKHGILELSQRNIRCKSVAHRLCTTKAPQALWERKPVEVNDSRTKLSTLSMLIITRDVA